MCIPSSTPAPFLFATRRPEILFPEVRKYPLVLSSSTAGKDALSLGYFCSCWPAPTISFFSFLRDFQFEFVGPSSPPCSLLPLPLLLSSSSSSSVIWTFFGRSALIGRVRVRPADSAVFFPRKNMSASWLVVYLFRLWELVRNFPLVPPRPSLSRRFWQFCRPFFIILP